MKIELSDLSGLPDGLKSLVESAGDKHALDLSKLMPSEDLSGLKSALQKERENAQAWSKLGDKPDAVAQRIADLEEKAKGTGKGAEEAQAKLDAMRDEYEGPSGKMTALNRRLQTVLQSSARASLQAELAKVGFIPEAIDDVTASAMGRIQFSDDGAPKVMTVDGKPMIGSGADHGATLTDLAKELAASKPYAVRDAGTGGSGKLPGSSGGKPDQKTATRAQFDGMSHSERSNFSKSGGKVVD